MDTDRIEKFLKSTVDEGTEKIVLSHAAKASGNVAEFPIPPANERLSDWYATAAREIRWTASEDAEEIGGVQKYRVVLERSDGSHSRTRCIFRAGEANEEDDFDSEAPTMRGHLQQMMRHNEALVRASLQSYAKIIETQGTMLERSMNALSRAEENRLEMMELMGALYDKKEERIALAEDRAVKRRFVEDGGRKAIALLPLIAHSIAEKKGASDKLDTVSPIIVSLLETIDESQIDAILPLFDNERADKWLALYRNLEKQKEAAKAGKTISFVPSFRQLFHSVLKGMAPDKLQALKTAIDKPEQLALLKVIWEDFKAQGAKETAKADRDFKDV